MTGRAYVYRVDLEALPQPGDGLDGLEVLVTVYDANDKPEVALRPSVAGIALRVWGPPLELVGQS